MVCNYMYFLSIIIRNACFLIKLVVHSCIIYVLIFFQILSKLNSKEMTINEEVYAALIFGHAESNDIPS